MKNALKRFTKTQASVLIAGLLAGACANATTYVYRVPAKGLTGNSFNFAVAAAAAAATPLVSTAVMGTYGSGFINTNGALWTTGLVDGYLPTTSGGSTAGRTAYAAIYDKSQFNAGTSVNDHATYLKSDGTLWSTGNNGTGQLGDGTTTNRPGVLVPVGNPNKYVAVSGGYDFTIALKDDGTIWGTGQSNSGQFGSPTSTTLSFVQVTTVPSPAPAFKSIAAAYDGAFALTVDGTLWSVGRNDAGSLGNGTTGNGSMQWQTVWKPAATTVKFTKVAPGNWWTVALDTSGNLWGTGGNYSGQFGVASPTNTSGNLIQVAPGHVFTDIAVVGHSTIALKADGTVWAAGENKSVGFPNYPVFGNGSAAGTGSTTFIRVDQGQGPFVKVLTNFQATGVLLQHQDGTLWGTGSNYNGQLGLGAIASVSTWTKLAP